MNMKKVNILMNRKIRLRLKQLKFNNNKLIRICNNILSPKPSNNLKNHKQQ